MSRNSKKLNPEPQSDYEQQAPLDDEPLPPEPKVQSPENPFGLSFVVPTDTVELPSKGQYYKKSSPLYGKKAVEIRHMTAREEDLLSPASNASSKEEEDNVFEKLLDALMVDKDIKTSMFLEEDKMALLLQARRTGYGAEYETSTMCPNCNKRTPHVFDLSISSVIDPPDTSKYEPTSGTFSFTLPISKIAVELEDLTTKMEEDLEEEKKKKEKYNLAYNGTLSFVQKVLVSANGVKEREMLNNLIEVLPAADAKEILNFYSNCRPALSTMQEVNCTVCGHQTEREAPLSWAFFRTDI